MQATTQGSNDGAFFLRHGLWPTQAHGPNIGMKPYIWKLNIQIKIIHFVHDMVVSIWRHSR